MSKSNISPRQAASKSKVREVRWLHKPYGDMAGVLLVVTDTTAGSRDDVYMVREVIGLVDDECVHIGWEFFKCDHSSYLVVDLAQPWTCECADYYFRREYKDPVGCKHVQATRLFLELEREGDSDE